MVGEGAVCWRGESSQGADVCAQYGVQLQRRFQDPVMTGQAGSDPESSS